jgi:hypothetical protein
MLKEHAEWLQSHDRAMSEARQRGQETDERIQKLVSAIGELTNLESLSKLPRLPESN